jgi:hydroxylamine reductase (hybrid-cluster protein)
MLEKAAAAGVLATQDEDIRSLRELVIYGLKGMAAYAEQPEIWERRTMKSARFFTRRWPPRWMGRFRRKR